MFNRIAEHEGGTIFFYEIAYFFLLFLINLFLFNDLINKC